MNCLVVAATALEITPFLEQYRLKSDLPEDIDVVITGIGLTAATYSLTKQLQFKRPELIIQAGIGGCYNKNIALGSDLAIKKEIVADQAVTEKAVLKTMFDLGLLGQNQYPYTKGWLENKTELLKKIKLKKVTGISVNEITTSSKKIKQYEEKFKPVVESMEGAALHYVALMEKIPFLQIRSVSNYAGERNKKNWKMKESIINLNLELTRLLQLL